MCVFVCVSGHRCRCLCVDVHGHKCVCVCQGIWVRVSVCVSVHGCACICSVFGCDCAWVLASMGSGPRKKKKMSKSKILKKIQNLRKKKKIPKSENHKVLTEASPSVYLRVYVHGCEYVCVCV